MGLTKPVKLASRLSSGGGAPERLDLVEAALDDAAPPVEIGVVSVREIMDRLFCVAALPPIAFDTGHPPTVLLRLHREPES